MRNSGNHEIRLFFNLTILSAVSGFAISILISTLAAAPSALDQFIDRAGQMDVLVRGGLFDIVEYSPGRRPLSGERTYDMISCVKVWFSATLAVCATILHDPAAPHPVGALEPLPAFHVSRVDPSPTTLRISPSSTDPSLLHILTFCATTRQFPHCVAGHDPGGGFHPIPVPGESLVPDVVSAGHSMHIATPTPIVSVGVT